jgi:cell filamentation protein
VSGENPKAGQQANREQREAQLVFARLKELYESPKQGGFDTAHLKAIHAYLFQDLPQHQPGKVRADSDGWNKARELEGRGPSHVVRYAHKGVEARIDAVLKDFGGPDRLKGIPAGDAAVRLAKLYGDLDQAHGFYEGNSRTLREFTRELADAAGYTLDWRRVGMDADARNALYIARDIAVLERLYPGLTEERAMATNDRAEYEAWFHLEKLRKARGEKSLEAIIRDITIAARDD